MELSARLRRKHESSTRVNVSVGEVRLQLSVSQPWRGGGALNTRDKIKEAKSGAINNDALPKKSASAPSRYGTLFYNTPHSYRHLQRLTRVVLLHRRQTSRNENISSLGKASSQTVKSAAGNHNSVYHNRGRAGRDPTTAGSRASLDDETCKQEHPSAIFKSLPKPKAQWSQARGTQQCQAGPGTQNPLRDVTNKIRVQACAGSYRRETRELRCKPLLPSDTAQRQQQTDLHQRWQQQHHGHHQQGRQTSSQPPARASLQKLNSAEPVASRPVHLAGDVQVELQRLVDQVQCMQLRHEATLERHEATCRGMQENSASPFAATRNPAMIPLPAMQPQQTSERACSPIAPSPWVLSRQASVQQAAACQAPNSALASAPPTPTLAVRRIGPGAIETSSRQLVSPLSAQKSRAVVQSCQHTLDSGTLQCLSPSVSASIDGSSQDSMPSSLAKGSNLPLQQASSQQLLGGELLACACDEALQQSSGSLPWSEDGSELEGEGQLLARGHQQRHRLGSSTVSEWQQQEEQKLSPYYPRNLWSIKDAKSTDGQQHQLHQVQQAKQLWTDGQTITHLHPLELYRATDCTSLPQGHSSAASSVEERSNQSASNGRGGSLFSSCSKHDGLPAGRLRGRQSRQQDVEREATMINNPSSSWQQVPGSLQQLALQLEHLHVPPGHLGFVGEVSTSQATSSLSERQSVGGWQSPQPFLCAQTQSQVPVAQRPEQQLGQSSVELIQRSHHELFQHKQEPQQHEHQQQRQEVQQRSRAMPTPSGPCCSTDTPTREHSGNLQQLERVMQHKAGLLQQANQGQLAHSAANLQSSADQQQPALSQARSPQDPGVDRMQIAVKQLDVLNDALLASAAALIQAGQQEWQRLRTRHYSRVWKGTGGTPSGCSTRKLRNDHAGASGAARVSTGQWQSPAPGASKTSRKMQHLTSHSLRHDTSNRMQQQPTIQQTSCNHKHLGALQSNFTWPNSRIPGYCSPALSRQQYFTPSLSSTKATPSFSKAPASDTYTSPYIPAGVTAHSTDQGCQYQEWFHTPRSDIQHYSSPSWPLPVGQCSSSSMGAKSRFLKSGRPKDLSAAFRDAGRPASDQQDRARIAPAPAEGHAPAAQDPVAALAVLGQTDSTPAGLSSGQAFYRKPQELIHRETAAHALPLNSSVSPSSSTTSSSSKRTVWCSPLPSPSSYYSASCNPAELAAGLLQNHSRSSEILTRADVCEPTCAGTLTGAWTVHTNLLAGQWLWEAMDNTIASGNNMGSTNAPFAGSKTSKVHEECSPGCIDRPPAIRGIAMRTWETSAAETASSIRADS
jgi:hypothetical protein